MGVAAGGEVEGGLQKVGHAHEALVLGVVGHGLRSGRVAFQVQGRQVAGAPWKGGKCA